MDSERINKSLFNEPDFVGVFARDRLPDRTRRPAGLVINLDQAKDPGSHWVAYYITADGMGEYFDPLGEPVPHNEILSFIKRNSSAWQNTVYSNIAFQSPLSSKCGAFVIFYLRNRLRGNSACQVHAMLSQNPRVNDAIVSSLPERE